MSFNPVLIVVKVEKPEWYRATADYAKAETRTAIRQLMATHLLDMAKEMVVLIRENPRPISISCRLVP